MRSLWRLALLVSSRFSSTFLVVKFFFSQPEMEAAILSQGDPTATEVIAPVQLQQKNLGALRYNIHAAQGAFQAGTRAFSVASQTAGPANPIQIPGAQTQFNVVPSSVTPDFLGKYGVILAVTLQNVGAAPLTVGCYAHLLVRNITFRFTSSINLSYLSEANLAWVLSQMSDTQLAMAGASMLINPATYAAAPLVLAAGASRTVYVPIQTPISNRAAYMRALNANIEFTLQWSNAADIVTAGAAADLSIQNTQLIFSGYKAASAVNAAIAARFLAAPTMTRLIVPTAAIVAIPGGVPIGQYQVGLEQSTGLVTSLFAYSRVGSGSARVAFTPTAGAMDTLTVRADSQPLPQFAVAFPTAFYRAFFGGASHIDGAALATLGINVIPFTPQVSLSIGEGAVAGSFFVNQSSNLLVTSTVLDATTTEAVIIYNKVQVLVQNGAELSLKIL